MTTLEQTLERIEKSLARIAQALENQTSHQYQYTPEGNPICPRHNIPMKKREKQGDTWYSHTVIDPVSGEATYCRGYASKNSPGWDIEDPQQPRQVQQPRQAQQPRRQPSAAPVQTQNLASPACHPKPVVSPAKPSKIQNPPSTIQNPPDLAAAIRELKGGRQ